jgi:hypothetical protein
VKIIKNCKKEFNIATTSTLQIGTLNYYRNCDNRFIVDPEEGSGNHTIHSGGSKVVLPNNILTELRVGLKCENFVLNPTGRLRGSYRWPNVYIFCCSLVDEPTKELSESFGYNSFYEIVDPSLFMRKVQDGFTGRVKLHDPTCRFPEVIHIHGPVKYQCDREHSHLHSEINVLSDLMIQDLFTKPTFSPIHPDVNYEQNQEYRFVWVFLEDNTKWIAEVADDPILVTNIDAIRQACWYL